jgi:hypothetical protein
VGQFIDAPAPGVPPLYFLWSIERIGVLYDQKLIAGKDWYGWGSALLVAGQNPDGSWLGGQYHGMSPHVDTCLALLFLKRVNLVQDLTDSLRLATPLREPSSSSPPSPER